MPTVLRLWALTTIVLLVQICRAAESPNNTPALVDVFQGKADGFPAYRIPSVIVSNAGTVLAFAEGRASLADHARNKLVLKRSTDGGATWGAIQVIAGDGDNCLNNPCALVLRDSGTILLMYQRYPQAHDEKTVIDGIKGELTTMTYLITSQDDGKTWSAPRDITPQVKRPTGVTSMASGPGIGIQLRHGQHAGRIIFPFNQGPLKTCENYAAYSDDGGKTWAYGQLAPVGEAGRGDEVQMVELTDGRIMLNTRNRGGKPVRRIAHSADGGGTWSPLVEEPQLLEPRCMASIIRHSEPANGQPGAILFSNPASPNKREKGTIYLSTDEGKTWGNSRVIYPGSFAYSCLTVFPDGAIGCLFERDGYGKISFAKVTLQWVREGGKSK